MIGIVDYNAGNIRSVERALTFLGAPFVRSSIPAELEKCSKLLFPGVGEAAYAMKMLKERKLDDFLRSWAKENRTLMGICLGSQIIFDESEEGGVKTLGILPGKIRHFKSVWSEKTNLKVPHIGWSSVKITNGGSALLDGIKDGTDFYFVHSYLIQSADDSVVKAEADYGVPVPAAIECGNISAFQFHPEKSGVAGLRILCNFAKDEIDFENAVSKLSGGKNA